MKRTILASLIAGASAPAFAHPGHEAITSFGSGFLHPITGLDHLLVMLAVGLWAGFMLQNRKWRGAAAFMGGMGLGALTGILFSYQSFVEPLVLSTLVAIGCVLYFSKRQQSEMWTVISLAIIALVGSLHGFAHVEGMSGNEMTYIWGILLSTSILHLIGFRMAAMLNYSPRAQQFLGASLALAGLGIGLI